MAKFESAWYRVQDTLGTCLHDIPRRRTKIRKARKGRRNKAGSVAEAAQTWNSRGKSLLAIIIGGHSLDHCLGFIFLQSFYPLALFAMNPNEWYERFEEAMLVY